MTKTTLELRLARIEKRLADCTVAEYPALAAEYSKIVSDIETEENLYSANIKKREKRSALSHLVTSAAAPTFHALNQ
ncbi:MAG: hypothetical protein J6T12_03180 [Salinivirgaceae bacterium]|nr:hypothetical protein [Salinivirgaceae bacterium]